MIGGSVNIIGAIVFVQPFLSVTVGVYEPAQRLVISIEVELYPLGPDHNMVRGVVPPATVMSMAPSQAPGQDTSVLVTRVIVIAEGLVILKLRVRVHPAQSVTVTVKVRVLPAVIHKPVMSSAVELNTPELLDQL